MCDKYGMVNIIYEKNPRLCCDNIKILLSYASEREGERENYLLSRKQKFWTQVYNNTVLIFSI